MWIAHQNESVIHRIILVCETFYWIPFVFRLEGKCHFFANNEPLTAFCIVYYTWQSQNFDLQYRKKKNPMSGAPMSR